MASHANGGRTSMSSFSMVSDLRPAPGSPPTPAHYDRTVELVQTAERLGYDTVWTSQQHGVDDGYMPAPLILLSALARETSRIRLGTAIVLLTLSQPRRVAEEAALVDVLSDGRLTLGVGAGHHPHEFAAFGRRLEDRARLMEDGIPFLRQALSAATAPDGLPLAVPPVQRPLPLLAGGLARPAVERAARLADGHIAYSFFTPDEELPTLWQNLIAPALERHDRDPASFKLVVSTLAWPSDDWEAEWREHVGAAVRYQQLRYYQWAGYGEADLPELLRGDWDLGAVREQMLVGPRREVAERLAAIRAVYPFAEIMISPALPGVPFELAERCVRTFAAEVAPALRD
jgi:alkanesulfonate monooxygenase SsuD/methylene tetrahydromethanopterin reductase-like flavin-dependent oxidoreductase (luciferase family)